MGHSIHTLEVAALLVPLAALWLGLMYVVFYVCAWKGSQR